MTNPTASAVPSDIHILPPQLANQIAAGEVVERPASVVKELVENSLDAGATRITIDIEKGGRQLIRVRDNGSGVAQQQLTLALSRHATSKIATLDDLEAIHSLGFRGEALASISSVARLTLSSRPKDQAEAWSARAEGRDMAVTVQPAAHPVGTTLEVRDLFFNTPARRRFLRTDKTEFAHIDELIKRIALSRFDVGFTLTHNGKVVRQLPLCSSERAREKRVALLASERFMAAALALHSSHDGLTLSGWLCTDDEPRSSETQYSYVNGRMMRDKLLNHAIRQACQEQLGRERLPGYVLYLTLDAAEVDVNVHPAKHEVRFHQARLVHDFVYQVLSQALSQRAAPELSAPEAGAGLPGLVPQPAQSAYSGHSAHAGHSGQSAYSASGPAQPRVAAPGSVSGESGGTGGGSRPPLFPARGGSGAGGVAGGSLAGAPGPDRQQLAGYHRLLASGAELTQPSVAESDVAEPGVAGRARAETDLAAPRSDFTPQLGRALCVVRQRFMLLLQQVPDKAPGQESEQLSLLCLHQAWRLRMARYLMQSWQQGLAHQPLLVPLSLQAEPGWQACWQAHQARLSPLGFGFEFSARKLVVSQVPSLLRQSPLQRLLPELFTLLQAWPAQPGEAEQRALCELLAGALVPPEQFSAEQGRELLGELAAGLGANLAEALGAAVTALPLDSALLRLMTADTD